MPFTYLICTQYPKVNHSECGLHSYIAWDKSNQRCKAVRQPILKTKNFHILCVYFLFSSHIPEYINQTPILLGIYSAACSHKALFTFHSSFIRNISRYKVEKLKRLCSFVYIYICFTAQPSWLLVLFVLLRFLTFSKFKYCQIKICTMAGDLFTERHPLLNTVV